MKRDYPSTLTVLIDSREKNPWVFPETFIWGAKAGPRLFKIRTKVVTLDVGDYVLEGFEHIVAIERKNGMNELRQNLISQDRFRFLRALGDLVDCVVHPCLMVEASLADASTPTRWCEDPTRVLDKLLSLQADKRFDLVWLGHPPKNPRLVGEFAVRYLWACVHGELWEKAPLRSTPRDDCSGL